MGRSTATRLVLHLYAMTMQSAPSLTSTPLVPLAHHNSVVGKGGRALVRGVLGDQSSLLVRLHTTNGRSKGPMAARRGLHLTACRASA